MTSFQRALTILGLALGLALAACGDDGAPADTGAAVDSSADTGTTDGAIDSGAMADGSSDTGTPEDAAVMDTGVSTDGGSDAAPSDAAADAEPDGAIPDAGDACHGYRYGAPAVSTEMVDMLPTMTGGVIPLGTFDLVRVQLTGALMGMARGTWVFESATDMQMLQAFTTGAALGRPTPRSLTWRTEGATLIRDVTCAPGDTTHFENRYRVRTAGGGTFLDVRQNTVLFTYRLRP